MAALRQKSETRNVGTKWSAHDNRRLIAMANRGASEAEMALTFFRTENGIREHLKLLAEQELPLSQPTATTIVSCFEYFTVGLATLAVATLDTREGEKAVGCQ